MEEIINTLDNWTLVKIFGGVSVILSGLVIYFSSLISKRISQNWKEKSDQKIEKIKGLINKNNSITATLTNQVGQNFQKLQDKRIKAVEDYWSRILLMKSTVPAVVNLSYNIFLEEELSVEKLNNTKSNFGQLITEIPQRNFTSELTQYSDQIAKQRPFLSDKLWVLMFAYSGFIGRSIYILKDGYEKDQIQHWKKDDGIDQILRTALNDKEFEYIKSLKVHSFDSMLQLLENKILQEINRLISSEEFTHNSLEELKKINFIIDQEKYSA